MDCPAKDCKYIQNCGIMDIIKKPAKDKTGCSYYEKYKPIDVDKKKGK